MVELNARLIPCSFKDKDGRDVYRTVVEHLSKVDAATITALTAQKTRLENPLVEIVSKTINASMFALLAEGYRVESEYFSIFVSCKGRFSGPDDHFDPKRHQLVVCIAPKAKAKKMLRNLKIVNILTPVQVSITIVQGDGIEVADTIKIGENFYLNGRNLALDEAKEDEGIFLMNKDGGVVAKAEVAESDVGTANGCFSGVSVEPGEYVLEIRTRNRKGASRKLAVARRNITVID